MQQFILNATLHFESSLFSWTIEEMTLRELSKDKIFKDVSVVFIANSLSSAFNLLYQLIMVRILSLGEFTKLSSLLSTFLILSVPTISYTTMVTKFTSKLDAHLKHSELSILINILFRHTLFFGSIIFVVMLIFAKQIRDYLHINLLTPVFILAGLVLFSTVTPVLNGALQGLKKFGWISSALISSGFSRLLFSVVFVALGFGLNGALSALLIAAAATFIISFIPIREYFYISNKTGSLHESFKEVYKYIIPVGIFYLCSMSLTNIDMVLVRHYFADNGSDNYAIAQIVGKIVLFLPGAIAIVMFPHTSGSHARDGDHLSIFKKSLKYTVLLCLAAIIFFNIAPNTILKILTSKAGWQYVDLARLFSITMGFFAINNLMFLYQLSINKFKFIKLLVPLTLLQILMIILLHPSLISVLWIMCLISTVLFVMNLKLTFNKNA